MEATFSLLIKNSHVFPLLNRSIPIRNISTHIDWNIEVAYLINIFIFFSLYFKFCRTYSQGIRTVIRMLGTNEFAFIISDASQVNMFDLFNNSIVIVIAWFDNPISDGYQVRGCSHIMSGGEGGRGGGGGGALPGRGQCWIVKYWSLRVSNMWEKNANYEGWHIMWTTHHKIICTAVYLQIFQSSWFLHSSSAGLLFTHNDSCSLWWVSFEALIEKVQRNFIHKRYLTTTGTL